VAADSSRRSVHVSATATLAEAQLIMSRSHHPGALEELAQKLGLRKMTRCGSAGVKATRVATGEADIYAQPGRAGSLWDACAPEALVAAAGGRVTYASGDAIDYRARELPNHRGFVATNGLVHAAMLELLAKLPVPPRVPV
jgi:3'(2'), 5'-bisphosphate nucleotidase